jgi:60 kDa SS-A/Ro ribonucleoprotein
MANKAIFATPGRTLPAADTVNAAGGVAYSKSDEHALAQFVTTGTFNDTFYLTARGQLTEVLGILDKVAPEFVMKAAVYGRKAAFMKDMPAFLVAWLFVRAKTQPEVRPLAHKAFDHVIDNGRMLRNVVQFMRSGTIGGNKSLGTSLRKRVCRWLNERPIRALINDSVGADPSIADVIKMTHPKGADAERQGLFAWILGRDLPEGAVLPETLTQLSAWRAGDHTVTPKVEFRLLTGSALPEPVWKDIARNAPWHMARMNLNTFTRHGVWKDPKIVAHIAALLADAETIGKVKVFPYQLLSAFLATNADRDVPLAIKNALQDALELSLDNVPEIPGQTVVIVDVSGSMSSAATGYRKGATSVVRCVDVAALLASALVRKNPGTIVVPVDTEVRPLTLNPRDSVATNTKALAALCGGGTALGLAFDWLTEQNIKADTVVVVSDNESWADRASYTGRYAYGPSVAATKMTTALSAWRRATGSTKARVILNDITPSNNTQLKDGDLIYNVGGFSDEIFNVISAVARGEQHAGHWAGRISAIEA